MAYTKTTWLDRAVQFANRYLKSGETSAGVTLTADPGTVTQAGTILNATQMNKIEQGIADAHDPTILLNNLKTVDGAGSGLDADLVRGYVPLNKNGDNMAGDMTFDNSPTSPYARAIKFGDGTGWRLPFRLPGGTLLAYLKDDGQLYLTPSEYLAWHAGNNGPGRVINLLSVETYLSTNSVAATNAVTNQAGLSVVLDDSIITIEDAFIAGRSVYLEVVIRVTAGTGSFVVNQVGGGAQITNVQTTSTTFVKVRSGAIPTGNITGKTLLYTMFCSGGGTVQVKSVRLIIL